jgi:hypothetical protein
MNWLLRKLRTHPITVIVCSLGSKAINALIFVLLLNIANSFWFLFDKDLWVHPPSIQFNISLKDNQTSRS